MVFPKRPAIARWLTGCSLLMVLSACGGNTTSNETGNLQIRLMAPAAGIDADTLVINLVDQADQPVTDAQVALEGNMNHAGMAPVFGDPVTDAADGTVDGHYRLPFTFTMLGDWILTVTVKQADGTTVTKDIELNVSESAITGDAAVMDHNTMDHSSMDHSGMDNAAMTDATAMVVAGVMARAVPAADGNGAVYLMLTNGTAIDDQLVGVASDVANAVEFHETINDNNVMRMEPRPEGFPLPAGETLRLEPGGKHIMLIGVKAPLVEGDNFSVTLTFTHAEPLTVTVPVLAIDADMDHSGHDMGN